MGILFTMQNIFSNFSSSEPTGSQGELIVYPCSGARRRRRPSTIFKDLQNRSANQGQIFVGHQWIGNERNFVRDILFT